MYSLKYLFYSAIHSQYLSDHEIHNFKKKLNNGCLKELFEISGEIHNNHFT